MSYQTYTTDALVCGSYDRNTADRAFLLFTREVGMLFATARSVREERSRQRYALQDFSRVRVSLVKGKSGWRIGSVEAVDNAFISSVDRQRRGAVLRLVRLVRRYLHGEEVLPHVFDDVVEALRAVGQCEPASVDEWIRLCELRLLHTLGYVHATDLFQPLLRSQTVREAFASYRESDAVAIDRLVERAAQASHL